MRICTSVQISKLTAESSKLLLVLESRESDFERSCIRNASDLEQ